MIYFDTSYLARLYVSDPGWEKVRHLAKNDRLSCSLHGKAEIISAFHRKFREGSLSQATFASLMKQFESDCKAGGFEWLPMTAKVLSRVAEGFAGLSPKIHLRAADALHLACAAEEGFKELYSNDAQLLGSAHVFGLRGINVIP